MLPDLGTLAAKFSPITQITYVFSEYSPTTGNAMSTKINQQAKALARLGGTTYIVASDRRNHGYSDGSLCLYSSPRRTDREYFTTRERRLDAAIGFVTGTRPYIGKFHREAFDAIPGDSNVVVLYNYAGAITKRLRDRIPGKLVLHLGNDVFRSWPAKQISNTISLTDLTVTVSQHVKNNIVRKIGEEPANLAVLHNGVDLASFTPSPDPRDATRPLRLLSVGNIIPTKGQHHLIPMMRELTRQGIDARLTIVGSAGLRPSDSLSPYEQDLRHAAEPLGDRVAFSPFAGRGEIAGIYRQADVFCMPVDWDEPAGQVITEAMASGLGIVSARRGGIPEYLDDAGLYIDPADAVSFAGAVAGFARNPGQLEYYSKRARKRAEQFSWDKNIEQLLILLDRVDRL